jgi:outer membrane biogenesis lipoprotein LolB
MLRLLPLFLLLLLFAACSDRNKQQPSNADLKQIEEEHRKTMQQMRQLTAGQGNSMLRVEPQASQKATQQQQKRPNSRQKANE